MREGVLSINTDVLPCELSLLLVNPILHVGVFLLNAITLLIKQYRVEYPGRQHYY